MSKQAGLAVVHLVTLGVLTSFLGTGCDERWHRIGEGVPPSASGGAAGWGMAGATGGTSGQAGAPGAGGVPGTAGAPALPVRMLPVPPRQAVTRMARLLWQTAPDTALVDTADSGALGTSEDVRQLAMRMMQDPRARSGLGGFYRWWLDLDRLPSVAKDPALFPTYNDELARAMGLETETFAVSVTVDMPGGTLGTLLTAPYSYLNERLAPVYGVTGVTGAGLRMTALDATRRAGLLTQASFLTLNAHETIGSPTWRGAFISTRLRCMALPPPPPTIPPFPPTPPGVTTRQRYEQHMSSPTCTACHVHMDGIGFAYEHYDAIGQYRSVENGLPIDSTAALPGFPAVVDAIGMAGALASDPQVQQCLPRQWLTYALGRPLTSADEAAATESHHWFANSGFVLRELVAGVIQTDAFLAGSPVCTPGANQTCNDNPALSSIRGECTAAARCLCPNSEVNPGTGRCL